MSTTFVFGSHERLKDLERRVGSIARSGLPVLIEGASGTGKEALAELLHHASGMGNGFTRILCRKSGPAVFRVTSMVNSGADLGDIYAQTRGTVFLKNVHLLSPQEQEQLLAGLTLVTDSEGGRDRPTPARLLSSATESLETFVNRGEFNPALYHRLSVYRIGLPPLRERREDIPELFSQMVRYAVNGGGGTPATSRLLDVLIAYDWPGNLRELQNVARTYVVTAQDEEIIAELTSRSRLTPIGLPAHWDGQSLKEQVKGVSQRLESEIILRTLERHHWNRRRAAQSLQISYRSLLYKMKNCNLRIQPQMAQEGK
jgi:two-component system, NtrC family, response regulator AtoC